jgi:osomolarity two-component system sensor histidine kinase SLN1
MRCRQIFTNFTSNATKFSPPGARIEVVTKLLWPSPPGAGAVAPIGPGDPDWVGNSGSEKISDTTAMNSNPPVGTMQMPTPANSHVPIFANLMEKGKQGIVSNDEDFDEKMEKPPTVMPVDQIVIRIEVRDTGMGIKKKDVKDAKLFSPYVQVRALVSYQVMDLDYIYVTD